MSHRLLGRVMLLLGALGVILTMSFSYVAA
ncbi:TPA: ferrous iron permease EfeU, partial [Listeria monocytogenes]|nr:ferrous iron permease EfeU [Listeria monocytogenes]